MTNEEKKPNKKLKQRSFLGIRASMAVVCVVCSIGMTLAIALAFLL